MIESDEKPHVHFIRISGTIASNKKKEFEQTVRFVFNQLPKTCMERTLTTEIQNEMAYAVYSEWLDETALRQFMASEEFQLIRGAFVTLGKSGKTVYGTGKIQNVYQEK